MLINRKLMSMFVLGSCVCSGYPIRGSFEKEAKIPNSEKKNSSSEEAFMQGSGPFWKISKHEALIDTGVALKDSFRDMIQFIKNNRIFIQENSNLGLSCKNNGDSYRLKMSFSMDDVEDLEYIFKKTVGQIGNRVRDLGLRSLCNEKLSTLSAKLSAFHTETNRVLNSIKLLPQSDTECAYAPESEPTSLEQESQSQLDYIIHSNDAIEVKTSLPSNIALELRLVGGKARNLKPHLDDNTVCVFSIGAQGVYQSEEWTRSNNSRKKKYLENGKSYLWFGTAHNAFPSEVYDALESSGVRKKEIAPLAHGVECKSDDDSGEMPISLLLIMKKSERNRGYLVFPKTVENFQVSIGSKRDELNNELKKQVKGEEK